MRNRTKDPTEAVAYFRTSSATNVGADKDSEHRQRTAVSAFAAHEGLTIVAEFSDPAVSGADPIETRPGFSALLDLIEGNGVRTVLVEDASRFARHLVVQEAGIVALIERGVHVLTASGEILTETDDPYKVAMRQIAGVFAQLEKARLVGKLKAARDRKRAGGQKVEGRKRIGERTPAEGADRGDGAIIVAEAKRLARRNPKTGKRRSLREISACLAHLSHFNANGKPFSASAVASILR